MFIRGTIVLASVLIIRSALAAEVATPIVPVTPVVPVTPIMPRPITPVQTIQVPPPPAEIPRQPDHPTYCDTHHEDTQNCPDN